jgi:glycosyltransferase involved in cell wall biosynthesis
MVKVVHIIKSLGRGGAEMLLPETIRLHDPLQFSFEVIYFLPWKNQLVEQLETLGIRVTCFAANTNAAVLFQAERIIAYIRREKIQLIHCHLPWAGFVGRYIYFRTGIPVLYTEHNKQERYHRITYWLNKLTFNFQTSVIAVSKDVAWSIEKNIKPKVPVISISNGVDTSIFQRNEVRGAAIRARYQIPQDALVVGIVTVFRFQKRLKEWLQVFAVVSKKYPNLYGLMVGSGPESEEIKEACIRLGLENKVKLPGLQINTRDWYSAMDVFMMSSSFEGMPVALLEAMSMECACISTGAGGISEIIENGKSGLLVKVDEWEKLEGCLGSLFDAVKRKKMGQEARIRVIHEFTLQKMVNKLEEVYDTCINAHVIHQPQDEVKV